MADEIDTYEIHLARWRRKKRLAQIVSLLRDLRGKDVTPEEALQRALGTELYLLTKVRHQGATIAVESKEGRVELDLTE
jgi:hypothetical protein